MFGSVKVTKNTNPGKYKYTGYGIWFDSSGEYSSPDGSVGKNVIGFGVDMSSSVHIDNDGKDILIHCKGPTQELDGTTFTVEPLYPINFTQSAKDLYETYTVMEATISCLFMLRKYIISKQKTHI